MLRPIPLPAPVTSAVFKFAAKAISSRGVFPPQVPIAPSRDELGSAASIVLIVRTRACWRRPTGFEPGVTLDVRARDSMFEKPIAAATMAIAAAMGRTVSVSDNRSQQRCCYAFQI